MGNLPGNTILPGDILVLVHVNLREGDLIWLGVFLGECLVDRSNGLAWPTPVRIDCWLLAIATRGKWLEMGGPQSAITMVEEPSILLNSADDEMLTVEDIFAAGRRRAVVDDGDDGC